MDAEREGADGGRARQSADGRHRAVTLPAVAGSVAVGREHTRRALAAWGWSPCAPGDRTRTAADVVLIVSELMANAVLHGSGPVELRLDLVGATLRIEVVDAGSALPAALAHHEPGLPGGHGLYMIDQLADQWGVTCTPGVAGKAVWAQIAAASPADPTPLAAPAGG
jgi:anti-sigma regulatory factor (Ser/Thr protein kinase)